MNKYKYSFDLGAFFGSEEKETRLKEAPEVETSILPRPKQKQEAVQEAKPEYDPYGFIPDFAAAYEGAGGVPTVGSDLPMTMRTVTDYTSAVDNVLNKMQEEVSPLPDLTAATPVATPEVTYDVVGGDNLTKIARKYDVSVDDIVEANGLADADALSIGQSLVIPSASQVDTPEAVATEEPAPVTAEAETTGGLMSRNEAESEATPVATTADSLTDLIYTDFVDAGQEGDEAHVGQDNKNITLPGGVVPDGLVYNGKAHTQDKSVVANFDKSKLDTSGAYKKVGSKTIRRSDYDSDKAFAKGVIGAFKDEAKKAAGDSWDSMSEGSKKAVVKIGWNKGTGWYTGKSAKAIYKELAKEKPDPSNLYSKVLVGSTVKGGGASIGIAKARANAWNETISATGGKEITKIVADNSGTNTALKYYDAEGNLLHTEQTSRSVDKYENNATTISKDSNGVW